MEVSGIYKAKVLVTQNLGFSPVIMSTDDLETVSDNEIPIRLYGMDLYTFDDNSVAAIKDSTIGMSFSVTREQLRGNFEMSANVMGNMGAIAAVVIFIASLAIIRYIISNNIVNEYRSIGIYKSLGYTNRQIAGFYRTGYLIVGLVATILGSFALLPVTKILGNISTKFATSFEITNISLITCAISIVIFMVLIFINITYSLRVIKKRTAVEIIRDDQSKGVGKVSKSVIKKASSAFAMAINNMFKHKRQTILSALSFMIASYLAMIFLTIGNSAHYMDEHYNSWFAIPENDVYVSGVLTDDVLEYLEDSDDVESFIYGSVVSAIPVSTDSVDISMNLFNFDVFNDANPEKTTVKITGDTPTKNDEIILTSLALQVLEMDVGDTISLTIDDTTKDYKIVGSYSSMLSNFGIMMTTEAMEEVYRDYVPNRAFVNLNDGVTISAFADDVEDSFTEVSVDEDWFFMDTAMQSTRTMLTSISSIMVVVFLLFTILSVSIIISINLENKMREAGIMKSLGFTGGYILRMNLYTSLITSIISIGFALVLHVTLSRRIIAQMMVDAVEDPVGLIAIFIALVLLITVVVTLIMNRKVYKVSPKILMEE